MKYRMKKVSLLVFYKEKQQILESLQELGVLHLTVLDVANEAVSRLSDEKNKYLRAIEIITRWEDEAHEEATVAEGDVEDIERKRDNLFFLQEEMEKSIANIDRYKKEKTSLEQWGWFEWDYIHKLETHGLTVNFYVAPKKEYYKYDFGDAWNFEIRQSPNQVFFVIVSKGRPPVVPFEVINLPHRTTKETEALVVEELNRVDGLKSEIETASSYVALFESQVRNIEDRLNFETANSSFDSLADGAILHIKGWFPTPVETNIKAFLEKNDLSYIIENPDRKDEIPVILKNRKYPKRFEAITKMFQLPDYHEFDLTPVVAVFYPVFFAYCLGDAGYGLILMILGLVSRRTLLKKSKLIADLIAILGVFSVIIGIIKGGSMFGISFVDLKGIPAFNYLSKFVLITDEQDIVFNSFNVALIVGLSQIILGVVISIVRKMISQSFIYSLSGIGKLSMIIGLLVIFLGKMQGIAAFEPYTTAGWVLAGFGALLVFSFHNPDLPLFKRLGGGVLPVYFIVTGLLGDTLSYIRLFALGVSSSILGIVINQIGSQIMGAGGGWIVVGIVFFILGHTLNLAIAVLGSFVHPLRLTFVEFYNNAEFKGGGLEYKPFKKHSLSNK